MIALLLAASPYAAVLFAVAFAMSAAAGLLANRKYNKSLLSAHDGVDIAWAEAEGFRAQTVVAQAEAAEMRAERDAAVAAKLSAENQLHHYQDKVIPNVIAERDRWHDLLVDDSQGYGAAQDLMMRRIEDLSRMARCAVPVDVQRLQLAIAERVPVLQTERVPVEDHVGGKVVHLPPMKGKDWRGQPLDPSSALRPSRPVTRPVAPSAQGAAGPQDPGPQDPGPKGAA